MNADERCRAPLSRPHHQRKCLAKASSQPPQTSQSFAMTTPPLSLLLSIPDEKLPHVLSYLTLKDVLHMRLVCAHFREVIFESTHHLWMDSNEEEGWVDGPYDYIVPSRRVRLLLSSFPKLRTLRLIGLRLVHQSLIQGRNGAAVSVRYICSLLQEAECAQNLECLELLDVIDSQQHESSGEWGAASPPSYSLHADIRLEQLRKLTITMDNNSMGHRENPLAHSLLRASHQITHLNLSGCSNFNDHDIEEAIMKPLSNTLVHLNLSGSGIYLPTIQSTILKELILQRCIQLCSLHADSFCPSLDILDLNYCPSFIGEGLLDVESGLFNVCPRLRTLNLRCCTKLRYIKIKSPTPANAMDNIGDAVHVVTSSQLMRLSDQLVSERLENINVSMSMHLASLTVICQALKRIDLGQCMHLEMLSISSPTLEMLDLSRLPLMLVSLRCPSLIHLNLAWCRDLDSKQSIVKCRALESVDIRGAMYITPDFFNDPNRKWSLSINR